MDLELFKSEVIKLGIDVSSEKMDKLFKYYSLLIYWNDKINLTAITKQDDVYLKHFYDSLTVCKVIDFKTVNKLCDIGTGAGFTGIVLKIFFPHIHITLIDSLMKRIHFLEEVVKELDLQDVTLVHGRAEEFACEHRDSYDLVTARAVASLNVLLEYSIPMVKTGGYFVAMRGVNDSDRCVNAMNVLNCRVVKCVEFNLPVQNSSRTLLLIKKESKIDAIYPRKNSVIKKHPL